MEEWVKNPNNIYIGRKNPYVEGPFSSKWRNPFSVKKLGRGDSIKKYKEYILECPELMKDLHELKEKTLVCWRYPEKCHGNVLIELLKNN